MQRVPAWGCCGGRSKVWPGPFHAIPTRACEVKLWAQEGSRRPFQTPRNHP